MMSSVPLETCWAFNKRWNNKLYYKVATCWLFLLTVHKRQVINLRNSCIYLVDLFELLRVFKVCGSVHLQSLEWNNQLDATINRKIYCLVVQILLNMFRALLCPSSGARQTVVAASGFRTIVEVEVFSVVFGLLVTNKPTTAENTSISTFIRKPENATAVWRAPDDGHCNARNMLSSICTTRQ